MAFVTVDSNSPAFICHRPHPLLESGLMRLDRLHVEKTTFAEADAANGWQTWRHRTPRERLEALESLRLLRIPRLPDGSLPRLQRLHIVVERGSR